MFNELLHKLNCPLIQYLASELLDQNKDLFYVQEERLRVAQELLFLFLKLCSHRLDDTLLLLLLSRDIVGLADVGPCVLKALVVCMYKLIFLKLKRVVILEYLVGHRVEVAFFE
jgi:hypothetical protein